MKRYYFLLLALCFTALASAQIDRSKAPASGPAPKVSIGEYESFTLKNGLKVLVVENNKIPQLNISLNIVRDPLLEGDKSSYTHIAGELWGKATENAMPSNSAKKPISSEPTCAPLRPMPASADCPNSKTN